MQTFTEDTFREMSITREDLEDIAYRCVEWPESFTPEKLTIQHLSKGYEYPISGDEIALEKSWRARKA